MRIAPKPTPISVNGVVIANGDIAREVQNHEGASPAEAWAAATRALVVRALLAQRAGALGLTAEPRTEAGVRETEEEALIRALLEAEVKTPSADEATCRHYYQSNRARFRAPDLFEPLHILFKAAQSDAAAYAQATAQAEIVLAEVIEAPDRFERLARSLSDCPSAEQGGRLGQIVRGETTPEFEAALQALQPGQTQIVGTRYGVHVLRLDRKIDGEVLPFEQVQARIARYLEDNAARRAAAQYVALLAGQARIDGFVMAAAASPLVQ
jgi:peptidyl-prolyl cis-trans isomerase C